MEPIDLALGAALVALAAIAVLFAVLTMEMWQTFRWRFVAAVIALVAALYGASTLAMRVRLAAEPGVESEAR